jgi:hypothetical protein
VILVPSWPLRQKSLPSFRSLNPCSSAKSVVLLRFLRPRLSRRLVAQKSQGRMRKLQERRRMPLMLKSVSPPLCVENPGSRSSPGGSSRTGETQGHGQRSPVKPGSPLPSQSWRRSTSALPRQHQNCRPSFRPSLTSFPSVKTSGSPACRAGAFWRRRTPSDFVIFVPSWPLCYKPVSSP